MNGWIILDKSSGIFSRTAGGRISRMFGAKTFGHIGTLDPMASGVLPIALGNATKVIPFIEDLPGANEKEYIFAIRFGIMTDTLDITGTVTECDNKKPNISEIQEILPNFIGKIRQTPPLYSAVHINGRRAYQIIRNGENLEIPTRTVEIAELKFLETRGEDWLFRVRCSRGTYVRSLSRDIASATGCIGVASLIRRIRTGQYDVKNAVKLDFLENLFNNGGDLSKFLNPTDFGLGDIPVINLGEKSAVLYRHGGFIKTDSIDGLVRVYCGNTFIGIGQVADKTLRPKRTI